MPTVATLSIVISVLHGFLFFVPFVKRPARTNGYKQAKDIPSTAQIFYINILL